MHPRFTLAIALAAASTLAGCTPPSPQPVAPEALPEEASFSSIGNTGQVYRLTDGQEHASFPVSPEIAAALLPNTIRLFHFGPGDTMWTEIDHSRFDPQTRSMVADNLRPGYYTGFGFSAEPAANVAQLYIFDAQSGVFANRDTMQVSPAGLGTELARLPSSDARSDRLGIALGHWMTVGVPECKIADMKPGPPDCTCPNLAGTYCGTSCPEGCKPRACCSCDIKKEYVPRSIVDLLPCPPDRPGCDLCLVCGAAAGIPAIAPRLPVTGVTASHIDGVFRDLSLHELVGDSVVGNTYKVAIERAWRRPPLSAQ